MLMELPILSQTYTPDTDAMVRAVKRVDRIVLRTVANETALDCATCFDHAAHPNFRMFNTADEVRIPDGWSAVQVMDAIEEHFADAGTTCRKLQCNETTWPTGLAEETERRGFKPDDSQVMLMQRYAEPTAINEDLQIIPARAAYRELKPFMVEANKQWRNLNDEVALQMAEAEIDFLDEPRLEMFLGRLNNEPVGYVSLITLGQIGLIFALFTLEEHRRKSVARTLLRHIMDHCTRAMFEQVILEVDPSNCAAKSLYESVGFQTVASFQSYKQKNLT